MRVFELPDRDWVLYLKWTDRAGKRRHESLGKVLRTADGKIVRDVERWAKAQATAKNEALIRTAGGETEALDIPLTIGEAKARVTDKEKGKYPHKSQHRRETEKSLDFACAVWGGDRAWNTIRRADIRQLGRARIDELLGRKQIGLRGSELTVQRVLTVAQWLRDEELIDEDAAVASKGWKAELRTYWLEASKKPELATPSRPRHTIDELRRILKAAWDVDPRFGLMLEIGAEQRLGQVARVHRSGVDIEKGTVRIPTRGKKKGAVIKLTAGQKLQLARVLAVGYLAVLETEFQAGHIRDYPLFPSGQMPGGRSDKPMATVQRHAGAAPLNRRTIVELFPLVEAKAEVAHVPGRGAYGLRRVAVDEAKKREISRDAMREHGGWSDNQMPDLIYADQDAEHFREEARDVRASIRGEVESGENDEKSKQTTNTASKAESGV